MCCCINWVHSFDLNSDQSTYKSITIKKDVSLTLYCLGQDFTNKSWTIVNGSELAVSAFTFGNGVALKTACYKSLRKCEKMNLKCDGLRKATGDRLILYLNLYPECLQKRSLSIYGTTTTSPTYPNQSFFNHGIPEKYTKPQHFLGLIIGFAVCAMLAFMSCFIVFLHKQCSDHRLNKFLCFPSYGRTSHTDTSDSSQRSTVLRGGGNIPLAQFSKRATIHEL